MSRAAAAVVVALLLLPGGAFASARPVANVTLSPLSGPVGTTVRVAGTGLPPGVRIALIWHTADARWLVSGGRFQGVHATSVRRALTVATVNTRGQLHASFRVPADFGFVHDVTAKSGDEIVARAGFTILPHMAIAPTSGPEGTPIIVTVTGLGYRFYESGWHLMYDTGQTGWVSAVTTHGTAVATIPAAGGIGPHLLQLLDGPRASYLNIEQSPNYQPVVPYHHLSAVFTVTAGAFVPPSDPGRQQLLRERGASSSVTRPALTADFVSGTVGSPVHLLGTGFSPHARVALTWSTVVGNRIGRHGWETVRRPLEEASTDAGGRFALTIRTPDDLGGPHRLTARAGTAVASMTYTITPSLVSFRPRAVAPGGMLDLTLKGGGWTDTGNIYTLVLDNAYVGYACRFNSQGTITIHLGAPVQPGWHFIDLYPAIYHGSSQFATSSNDHYQLPMLNVRDHPGGRLPAFHLAFEVQSRPAAAASSP